MTRMTMEHDKFHLACAIWRDGRVSSGANQLTVPSSQVGCFDLDGSGVERQKEISEMRTGKTMHV